MRSPGREPAEPGWMSASSRVFAAVPSETHSSSPWVASVDQSSMPSLPAAAKTMRDPKRKKPYGDDELGLELVTVLMSRTRYAGSCARAASGAASERRTASAEVLIGVSGAPRACGG